MESLCRRAAALLPDELGLWLETAWEYRATRLLVGLALLRLGLNLYTSNKRRRRRPFGPLGKCPWITLNGHEYADSSLILDVLSSQLEARLPVQCDEQRLAAGRAFQVMLEEHTAWCVFFKRYSLDKMRYVWPEFPLYVRRYMPFVRIFMAWGFTSRAREQGIGRFTEPQFFLGETVSDLDCCVFGMVCQLLYVSGPALEFMTHSHCENLVRHHDRMKELYWSDWDQCLE
ncbi:Failed axon connections [Amphibalanus amphitrite]|uniref:Failed axon connections n=1 Tax=Amphibalanus amphitrite TaxID=1232801 RepID=A0A6A4WN16_AMPAM|nr:Failed axon connections [Amphibalanus amphitrite]